METKIEVLAAARKLASFENLIVQSFESPSEHLEIPIWKFTPLMKRSRRKQTVSKLGTPIAITCTTRINCSCLVNPSPRFDRIALAQAAQATFLDYKRHIRFL